MDRSLISKSKEKEDDIAVKNESKNTRNKSNFEVSLLDLTSETKRKTPGRKAKNDKSNKEVVTISKNNCYICCTPKCELECEICSRKAHLFCSCLTKKPKEWFCQYCS